MLILVDDPVFVGLPTFTRGRLNYFPPIGRIVQHHRSAGINGPLLIRPIDVWLTPASQGQLVKALVVDGIGMNHLT